MVSAGPVRVDIDRHVVTVAGRAVPLPLKEFELLEMLTSNPGRLLTRGQLTLELGKLELDVRRRADPVELGLDVVATAQRLAGVVERATGDELVNRAGPRLHLQRLVLGTLHRHADVAHLLGDARHRLADLRLRLGGGVGGLDRLLAGAERVDLRLQALRGGRELLLLALQLRVLGGEVGDLLVDRGATGQRLTGQVVAAGGDRLLSLRLELVGGALQLLHLQLQALAARRHVGDAAAHLRQQLELLLVGVVQRLARVLVLVEDLVRLRLEDQGESAAHAHTVRTSRPAGRSSRPCKLSLIRWLRSC